MPPLLQSGPLEHVKVSHVPVAPRDKEGAAHAPRRRRIEPSHSVVRRIRRRKGDARKQGDARRMRQATPPKLRFLLDAWADEYLGMIASLRRPTIRLLQRTKGRSQPRSSRWFVLRRRNQATRPSVKLGGVIPRGLQYLLCLRRIFLYALGGQSRRLHVEVYQAT